MNFGICAVIIAVLAWPVSQARADDPWKKCRKSGPAKLVSACAYAKSFNPKKAPHIESSKDWVPTEKVDSATRLLAADAPDSKVEIRDLNQDTGLALIAYGAPGPGAKGKKTAWVNVDTLDCSANNLKTYFPRPNSGPAGTCTEPPLLLGGHLVDEITTLPEPLTGAAVDRAEAYAKRFQDEARKDLVELARPYAERTDAELAARVRAARNRITMMLGRARKLMPGGDCEAEVSGGTKGQAQRTCRMYAEASAFLDKHFSKGLGDEATAAELRKLIEERKSTATAHNASSDDLALKNLLYYGLESKDRDSLKLTLLRDNGEFHQFDKGGYFKELHNGYVLGGLAHSEKAGAYGKKSAFEQGTDCSQFINDVFGVHDLEKSSSTVKAVNADIYGEIAAYHEGTLPYIPDKPAQILASCFVLVDLRDGAEPRRGDIATFPGHTVLVSSFDAKLGQLHTVEAGGGTFNTVGPNVRPLYEPPCVGTLAEAEQHQDTRPVKAGLRVLRYSPHHLPGLPGCPIKFKP